MNRRNIFYIILLPCLMLLFQNCGSDSGLFETSDRDSQNSEDPAGQDPSGNLDEDIRDILDGAPVNRAFCSDVSTEIANRQGPKIMVSPAGQGRVMVNGQETTLRNVVSNAAAGSVIVLSDGTYTFDEATGGGYTGLYFTTPNVTLVGNSVDASRVVLDSRYANHGGQTGLITIDAANVTLAHLTVKSSIFHLIHMQGDGDGAQVHNVILLNGGQQFLKGSPGAGTLEGGFVTCSQFIMDSTGRANVWGYGAQDGSTACYTGGIDTHDANNWVVSDNTFVGIYCDETLHPAHGKKAEDRNNQTYRNGLAEFAIHMWNSDQGTEHKIERNRIVNCARGIGLGLNASSMEYGGVVRNNMIFSQFPADGQHDVGIYIGGVKNTEVYNNTIYFSSSNAYPNAIEYRFPFTTGVSIYNNLSNKNIQLRNGASGTVNNNVTNAQGGWFTDLGIGDLHLSRCDIAGVSAASATQADLLFDIDRDDRPGAGAGADIGADQCNP